MDLVKVRVKMCEPEGLVDLVKVKMCEPEGLVDLVQAKVQMRMKSVNLKASVSLFVPSSSLVAPLKLDAPKLDSRRARKRLRT